MGADSHRLGVTDADQPHGGWTVTQPLFVHKHCAGSGKSPRGTAHLHHTQSSCKKYIFVALQPSHKDDDKSFSTGRRRRMNTSALHAERPHPFNEMTLVSIACSDLASVNKANYR